MTDKGLEDLLSADHRALAGRLDDAPAGKTVARMKRRAWRKSLVVAAAILIGAAIAVTQLPVLAGAPTAAMGRWAHEALLAAAAVFIALVFAAAVLSLPDVD